MAFPALAALPVLLAKLGIGKAAAGAAASKIVLPSVVAAGKGAAVKGGFKAGLGAVKRYAGKALADYMGPGGVNPGNLMMNFGMDAGFGVLQGATTPGDLGDKIIAGGTTAIGGAVGGIGLTSALGKHKNNPLLRMPAEGFGSIGGDMMGQMVGDTVLRAKGGGTTPWEKVQQGNDQAYREMLEREMLAKLGVGGYNQTDLFFQDNGLA